MKKIKLFLIGLLFVACGSDTVTLQKNEYEKLKNANNLGYPKHIEVYGEVLDIYLSSDGCEYIVTYSYAGRKHYTHYPQCKRCFKNQLDTLKK